VRGKLSDVPMKRLVVLIAYQPHLRSMPHTTPGAICYEVVLSLHHPALS
jgi:hypothetical protein